MLSTLILFSFEVLCCVSLGKEYPALLSSSVDINFSNFRLTLLRLARIDLLDYYYLYYYLILLLFYDIVSIS